MPLVIVFTKFDEIDSNVSSSHKDYEERCRSPFGNVPAEIVSSIYSSISVAKRLLTPLFPARPKFRHLMNNLVTTTDREIISHSRNISAHSEAQKTQPRLSPVPLAWSVSQRASRAINIQAAIECISSPPLINLPFHTVRQSWAKQ